MTKLFDRAVEVAKTLPANVQDEIAAVVLQLAGHDDIEPVPLSDQEKEAIARSMACAQRGAFASEEDVRAVWEKYGL